MIHTRWNMGFSANLVIVSRNGSMSLADLSEQKVSSERKDALSGILRSFDRNVYMLII